MCPLMINGADIKKSCRCSSVNPWNSWNLAASANILPLVIAPAQKPGVGPRYAYVVHTSPFSPISESIPVVPAFWSPISPGIIGARREFERARACCEDSQCPHGLRARVPHAFTCEELQILICVLLVHKTLPASLVCLQGDPSDLNEYMPCSSITDCVHAPDGCTCAPSRWCGFNENFTRGFPEMREGGALLLLLAVSVSKLHR